MPVFMLDDLDISDGVNYVVEEFDPGEPDVKANRQTVTLRLTVLGGAARDIAVVKTNEAAIWAKLEQARLADGPDGAGTPVELRWTPGTLSGAFVVTGGSFVPASEGIETITFGYGRRWTLTLNCLAGIKGERVDLPLSGLLSVGGTALMHIAATGGDLPSPIELTLMDETAGTASAINRWRLISYSHPELTSGGYVPLYDLTASGAGSAVAATDAIGGTAARITAGTAWQTIASVTRGTADAFTGGAADVLLHARDSTAIIDAPSRLTLEAGGVQVKQSHSIAFQTNGNHEEFAWPEETTEGNLLILVMISGASVGQVNFLVPPDFQTAVTSVSSSLGVRIYYKDNCRAAEPPFNTAAAAGNNNGKCWVFGFELENMQQAPLDKTNSNGGNTNASGVGNAGATGTLSQAHEFILAAMVGTMNSADMVDDWGAGWIGLARDENFTFGSLAYQIVNATASVTPTFDHAGTTTEPYRAAVSTWKAQYAGGSLTPGDYEVVVTALDASGNESLASNLASVYLARTAGIAASWAAPAEGTVAQYRIYVRRNGEAGTWVYQNTGSTATSATISSLSGWTSGDPPDVTTRASQWRLRVGRGSGTTLSTTSDVLSQAAGSAWEWLLFPDVPLSPAADEGQTDAGPWYLEVQGKNASGTPTLDADAVLVVPRRAAAAIMDYRSLDLAVPRGWRYAGRQDGRRSLRLLGDTVALTASGNEITDLTRLSGAAGDGRAYPDRTVGIWKAATNLCTNGGFETNTTGWGSAAGVTIARSTEQAKFGSASLRSTYASGVDYNLAAYPLTLTAAAHVASIWLYIPSAWDGGAITIGVDGTFSGASTFGNVNANMALRDQWQRIQIGVTPVSGDLSGFVVVRAASAPTAGRSVYFDGMQVETGSLPTPYIETNGSTASRSAGRLQVPASGLDETQGWFAMRVRMPYGTGDDPVDGVSFPQLWTWSDGAGANEIIAFWSEEFHIWGLKRTASSTSGQVFTGDTFSAGDAVTVIGAWTATELKLSIDGGAFTTAADSNIPALAASTADLLSAGSDRYLSADVVWYAHGSGTLSNADAARLHACGDRTPAYGLLPDAAELTLLWLANRSDLALDGGSEAGSGMVQGRPTIGPGPTTLVLIPDVQSGVAAIHGVGATLRLSYWPLYAVLPGES